MYRDPLKLIEDLRLYVHNHPGVQIESLTNPTDMTLGWMCVEDPNANFLAGLSVWRRLPQDHSFRSIIGDTNSRQFFSFAISVGDPNLNENPPFLLGDPVDFSRVTSAHREAARFVLDFKVEDIEARQIIES